MKNILKQCVFGILFSSAVIGCGMQTKLPKPDQTKDPEKPAAPANIEERNKESKVDDTRPDQSNPKQEQPINNLSQEKWESDDPTIRLKWINDVKARYEKHHE